MLDESKSIFKDWKNQLVTYEVKRFTCNRSSYERSLSLLSTPDIRVKVVVASA